MFAGYLQSCLLPASILPADSQTLLMALQDGEEYEAEVVKIMEFGAFVDLPGGFGALLHISELANYRVRPSFAVCNCGCKQACALTALALLIRSMLLLSCPVAISRRQFWNWPLAADYLTQRMLSDSNVCIRMYTPLSISLDCRCGG